MIKMAKILNADKLSLHRSTYLGWFPIYFAAITNTCNPFIKLKGHMHD